MVKACADILVITGCGCLVAAGWMLEPFVGLGVLGALAVVLGVLISTKGNANDR